MNSIYFSTKLKHNKIYRNQNNEKMNYFLLFLMIVYKNYRRRSMEKSAGKYIYRIPQTITIYDQ